jgi:hypothetical protein
VNINECSISIPLSLVSDPNVNHAAMVVYGRLKLYAGKEGKAFPWHETLAREVHLKKSQLKVMLVQLRDAGWISWERGRRGCVYTVHPKRLEMTGSDSRKTGHLKDPEIAGKPAIREPENRPSEPPHPYMKSRSEKNTPTGGGVVGCATNPNALHPEPPPVNGTSAPAPSDAVLQTAERIHERHPSGSGRRDCPIVQVEKRLTAAIARHRSIPTKELLDRIDRNHVGWCASTGWHKDDGRYAKSLENWLETTKDRYLADPPVTAATRPPNLYVPPPIDPDRKPCPPLPLIIDGVLMNKPRGPERDQENEEWKRTGRLPDCYGVRPEPREVDNPDNVPPKMPPGMEPSDTHRRAQALG